MTESKIESFFGKGNDQSIEEKENENMTQKRARSDGSSIGTSPTSKNTLLDEDGCLNLPEDAPFWVPTLFKSIDKINVSMHVINAKLDGFKSEIDQKLANVQSSSDAKIKTLEDTLRQSNEENAKTISELTDGVKFISDEYDEQKRAFELLMTRMDTLEGHHETIKRKCHEYEKEFVDQSALIDSLEQYGRRNCVLIHGIPESKGEDTDNLFMETIQTHLNVTLKPRDLDRTHRLG